MSTPIRTESVDALLDPARLPSFLDVTSPVTVESLDTLGYSGSDFFRVRIRGRGDPAGPWIVKRTVLADDWFSARTGDRVGREAAAVTAPELADIHRIFRLPYRAVAIETGTIALLMDDLSGCLLPDERTPLEAAAERSILDALADLHATFWASSALTELSWLHRPADFLHVMGPRGHDAPAAGGSARGVDEAVREGWKEALGQVGPAVRRALTRPAPEIAAGWGKLPHTLVHGDTKVANFALPAAGGVAVFDWAFVGRAPCTVDIGWYLAVNATRLAGTKEETLARYRALLEERLGRELDEPLWSALEEVGVVCGALMLLWSKGAALAAGREGAAVEWAWWHDRLERWVGRPRHAGSLADLTPPADDGPGSRPSLPPG